ncbi:hypothetical protein ACRALDRAFT_2057677 [Sodiomyces alcalophilus JCM 7366]|uniref:uncharacterized protein n=1 Tax=Sodiomyces alcalophilus JCM 7366 TaxID=591952 RepID=UPI0039B43886
MHGRRNSGAKGPLPWSWRLIIILKAICHSVFKNLVSCLDSSHSRHYGSFITSKSLASSTCWMCLFLSPFYFILFFFSILNPILNDRASLPLTPLCSFSTRHRPRLSHYLCDVWRISGFLSRWPDQTHRFGHREGKRERATLPERTFLRLIRFLAPAPNSTTWIPFLPS